MTTLNDPDLATLNNAEFYAVRERQARELGAKAQEPTVRSIHLKMADEYALKAVQTSKGRTRLSIAVD